MYSNLEIAIVDAVQMIALVPTAELKQPGQFVCSLIVVSMLFIARGRRITLSLSGQNV